MNKQVKRPHVIVLKQGSIICRCPVSFVYSVSDKLCSLSYYILPKPNKVLEFITLSLYFIWCISCPHSLAAAMGITPLYLFCPKYLISCSDSHMSLSQILFSIHSVQYNVGSPFAARTVSTLLGKSIHEVLKCVYGTFW